MDSVHPLGDSTRLLFFGEETLAAGFRLIGFETHSNSAPRDVDQLLRELQRSQAKAFVVVDEAVMAQDIPQLQRVLREGGRIVVIAVPALNAPPQLTSEVATRLAALFGAATLQASHTGEK
ncbi:ATPase [Chromatium weissei]|nr:ATPase [Chromatium weissei]